MRESKKERDKQISFFIRTTPKHYLRRARRTSKKPNANLNKPIGSMTLVEIKYADECMRIFREEDR